MSYLFRLKIDDWQSGRCVSEHNFLSPFCTDHIHTPLTPSVLWWITSAQPMWTFHPFVFVRMKSWNNQMSKCHLCKPAELIMKPCLPEFSTCILYIQCVNLEWATVSPFTWDARQDNSSSLLQLQVGTSLHFQVFPRIKVTRTVFIFRCTTQQTRIKEGGAADMQAVIQMRWAGDRCEPRIHKVPLKRSRVITQTENETLNRVRSLHSDPSWKAMSLLNCYRDVLICCLEEAQCLLKAYYYYVFAGHSTAVCNFNQGHFTTARQTVERKNEEREKERGKDNRYSSLAWCLHWEP